MRNHAIGTDWDVLNVDLNITFQEITYGRPVIDFWFKARAGNANILHKRTNAATAYVTHPASASHDKEINLSNANAGGSSLGFFAMDQGTDTIEIYVTF